MSDDFSFSDEKAASQDVWRLISTALEMPESANDPREYWDDVMRGTCMLLGMTYKLANELDVHHANCGEQLPAATRHVVDLILRHESEVREAWQRVIS